ncbi:MAG: hypothetical protein JXA36_02865 [Coriobacteriia bacterium]|nr:hypothetical protein [Coriobacteriia bacterium]
MSRSLNNCALALTACMVLLAVMVGCGEPGEKVGDPVMPAPQDLTTPESAVRSYLDWVSLSYRMANSEIPTATMTPDESVRVDSYIEYNRQEDKGIEQELESFEVRSLVQEESQAVLTAVEIWSYRYFSLTTLEYVSEPLSASYDTTYTLVASDSGWLVDRVEAAGVLAEP